MRTLCPDIPVRAQRQEAEPVNPRPSPLLLVVQGTPTLGLCCDAGSWRGTPVRVLLAWLRLGTRCRATFWERGGQSQVSGTSRWETKRLTTAALLLRAQGLSVCVFSQFWSLAAGTCVPRSYLAARWPLSLRDGFPLILRNFSVHLMTGQGSAGSCTWGQGAHVLS